jgi:multisubunit Na+/H+ antiporter MnhE subunit
MSAFQLADCLFVLFDVLNQFGPASVVVGNVFGMLLVDALQVLLPDPQRMSQPVDYVLYHCVLLTII